MTALNRHRVVASLLIAAGMCVFAWAPNRSHQHAGHRPLRSADSDPSIAGNRIASSMALCPTKSIQDLRVGDRVLAHNPEIPAAERATWLEPRWERWRTLELKMTTARGSVLEITMIRPPEWLDLCGGSAECGDAIWLDLPEMGARGSATIAAISAGPSVEPGAGQVVTATFRHPPSSTVLDVYFEGEAHAIGVTDNHLFWSMDQHAFVPIGEMAVGQRVRTYSGDTKRIEGKLPRPGPQLVYNLEVYGEHVYFVGRQGLLAHNAYDDKILAFRERHGLPSPYGRHKGTVAYARQSGATRGAYGVNPGLDVHSRYKIGHRVRRQQEDLHGVTGPVLTHAENASLYNLWKQKGRKPLGAVELFTDRAPCSYACRPELGKLLDKYGIDELILRSGRDGPGMTGWTIRPGGKASPN